MSGDTKILELVYRASIKDDFWDKIKDLRRRHEIPDDGFVEEIETNAWYSERGLSYVKLLAEDDPQVMKETVVFDDDVTKLLTYFELPASAENLIINYILNNNTVPLPHKHALCAVDPPFKQHDYFLSEEAQWMERGERYVRLLIHQKASKADVLEYIKKNWGRIKGLKGGPSKGGGIRVSNNKERDDLIFRYSQIPINILRQESGSSAHSKAPKDAIISHLIKKEGFSASTDTVRQVIAQQKKMRKSEK